MEAAADLITKTLSGGTAANCIAFHNHVWDLLVESYHWDLWAVAYIINGGCSDDGFLYFRAWLIGNGKERFEAAMANPSVVGEWVNQGDNIQCEMMMTPGESAYAAITGQDIPDDAETCVYPQEPQGQPWEERHLWSRFPTLTAKFGC